MSTRARHGVLPRDCRSVLIIHLTLLALAGAASAEPSSTCSVVISLNPARANPAATILPLNLAEVELYREDGAPIAPLLSSPAGSPAETHLSSTWTSSFDPPPGLVVGNCFDRDASTICATANGDANPSLTVKYDCSGGASDYAARVVVKNRVNAATGRCNDCGNRLRQFSLAAYNEAGALTHPVNGVFTFDSWSGGPTALDSYTFYTFRAAGPVQGAPQCVMQIVKKATLANPALPLIINLREINLLDYSNQPYTLGQLTAGTSSVFAPALGPSNLFDKNLNTFASTNATDPNPWVRIGYSCDRGATVPVEFIFNRLNAAQCSGCMSRITNFRTRFCYYSSASPDGCGEVFFDWDDIFDTAAPIYPVIG